MSNILITLFAYLIDRIFGEFSFFNKTTFKHPIVAIGGMVSYFEKRFYQNSVLRGFFLVAFILAITGTAALIVDYFLAEFHALLYIIASSFIASMFIAHKMLYDSVKGVKEKQSLNL